MLWICEVCALIIFFVLPAELKPGSFQLKEVFKWKLMDYEYPDYDTRKEDIESGRFIPKNVCPLGLETWKDKLFISLAKWKNGVPATLAYIHLKDAEMKVSPRLIPYPDWESNVISAKEGENEHKIIFVTRMYVDICDRLWLVDLGAENILTDRKQILPARILVYDLNEGKLVKKHTIKQEFLGPESFLGNIAVDVTKGTCDKAFAYIADFGANRLIVYDSERGDSWQKHHFFFHLDPLAVDYHIDGLDFQWDDGVFGLALSPLNDDGYRTLFFHPLSSFNEFTVSTKELQNKTGYNYSAYRLLGFRGVNSQSASSIMDEKTGVVFYNLISKHAIGCWNSIKYSGEYSEMTNAVLGPDEKFLAFPSDLKLDGGRNIWVLSNRLPVFLYDELDASEENFRVLVGSVDEAIEGTICASN